MVKLPPIDPGPRGLQRRQAAMRKFWHRMQRVEDVKAEARRLHDERMKAFARREEERRALSGKTAPGPADAILPTQPVPPAEPKQLAAVALPAEPPAAAEAPSVPMTPKRGRGRRPYWPRIIDPPIDDYLDRGKPETLEAFKASVRALCLKETGRMPDPRTVEKRLYKRESERALRPK
jgi:hypothetical protein